MKNNFNLDEFENFLSDSTEEHRMYPSDKVWRNIDQELHGSKRWPALTFGAILTGAIITAGLILIHPDKNLFTVNLPVATNESPVAKSANDEIANSPEITPTAKVIDFSKRRKANAAPYDIIASAPALETPVSDDFSNANGVSASGQQQDVAVFNRSNATNEELNLASKHPDNQLQESHTDLLDEKNDSHLRSTVNSGSILEATHALEQNNFNENTSLGIIESRLPVSDLKVNEAINDAVINPAVDLAAITKNKASRWSLLYYATPSISYRYLSEAKVIDLHQQNGPIAPNLTHGVNNFVRHKPITGYEFGAAVMYNLTPAVRLKAGLQANIRGYSIEAYASKREASTIVLNRGFYTDSLVAMSTISNQDGYRQIEITNRYFELSVPISMDMRVANWKKLQVYVAAGLQPTYQFNQSMYIVSSDYKNYIQAPDLVRHFNMNTSLEAFMSYKAGGVTWQVGPQIRYQLLPGATNQYPVRERLIDYGFKIGVVKTLK
ncbi:hypothetical protein BH10BAC3_BH10BAC3_02730 [soil metagenome]